MSSEENWILCGEESPVKGLEPCPLEKGHEDEHVFYGWGDEGVDVHCVGLQIYDKDGKSLIFMEVEEPRFSPEEVGVVITYLNAVTAHRRDAQERRN